MYINMFALMTTMKIFRREVAFWEMVFYASWTVLTIWFILKMAGVINTPKWLEFGVPAASLIIGSLGLFKNLMDSINKNNIGLVTLTLKFEQMDGKVDKIDKRVDGIDKKLNCVEKDVDFLKRKIT